MVSGKNLFIITLALWILGPVLFFLILPLSLAVAI